MTDIARLAIAIDSKDLKQAKIELDKLQKSGKQTESTFKKLPSVFTAIIASMAVREVVRYADSMTLVNSKLKLVTRNSGELVDVQKKLFDIAQESRVGYEDTVDLYSRMARSTKELGLSSEELLGITDTISKTLIISGGSAESMNAALVQLGQGFASGQLRGQELNSVLEQTPRLARAISDGMGIAYGDLRKYAEEGKITSEALINAIKTQTSSVNSEFSNMTMTVGQSVTQIDNSFMQLVGSVDDATGATSLLSGTFSSLSSVMDDARLSLEKWNSTVNSIRDISKDSGIAIWEQQLTGVKKALKGLQDDGLSWYENEKTYNQEIANRKWQILELEKLITEAKRKSAEAEGEVIDKVYKLSDAQDKSLNKMMKAAFTSAGYQEQRLESEKEYLALEKAGIDFRIDAEDRRHSSLMFELDIKRKQAKLIEDSDLKAIATAEVNYEIAEAELDHRLALGTLTESQYAMSMDLQNQYKNNVIKDYTYMGQAIRSLKDGMESEFGQFFDYLDDGFMDFGDLAKDILHQIYMDLIKMQFTQPAVSGIGDFLSGLGGGTTSVADAGTLYEGGASGWFAKGDSFSGSPSLSSHSNSVVSSPTPFFFASGGTPGTNLGVMGEAGSEAIMPLTRMSGGDLGVKTTAANVSVTIINNANAEVSTQEDNEGNITVILDAVANSISRGTGNIGSAMESTFGLSR